MKVLDSLKAPLVVLSIIGGIIVLHDFIDKKIDNKINEPEYISKLSKTLRAYLIINHKGNIVYDHGATSIIDSISVSININNIFDEPFVIIIHPKTFLEFKPLVECLSPVNYVETVARFKNKSWKYIFKVTSHSEPLPEILFRIEVLL